MIPGDSILAVRWVAVDSLSAQACNLNSMPHQRPPWEIKSVSETISPAASDLSDSEQRIRRARQDAECEEGMRRFSWPDVSLSPSGSLHFLSS